MKKRYRYRLPLSEDAVDGLGSVLMAAISGIFLLAAAVISFVLAGKAGTYVGIFRADGHSAVGHRIYHRLDQFWRKKEKS